MQTVTTIGFDIAKSVFQVHGVDAVGQVVIRRQLKRRHVLAFFEKLPPCLVGIEACASSHHWSRELQALGHTVRLMPPAYVKPYVKRQKNDMADAEAICEAVTRANMRFVPTKTPEQQSCLMLHRTRHLFIRQQTAVINSIRAHLAEFGIVAPVGRKGVTELLHIVADPNDKRVPEVVRACLAALGDQLLSLKEQNDSATPLRRFVVVFPRNDVVPSRRHAQHASASLKIVVRHPKKTFATKSANTGSRAIRTLCRRSAADSIVSIITSAASIHPCHT
jgi:transposase